MDDDPILVTCSLIEMRNIRVLVFDFLVGKLLCYCFVLDTFIVKMLWFLSPPEWADLDLIGIFVPMKL